MQTIETIFSAESMGPIFQLEKPGSLRLKSRENSGLEFKENFNWANRADYARTMAAFANNNGGYLVFGVADSPRRLKGIDSGKFLATEPAKITEFLNEYFSPEIHWEIGTYEFENLSFGILYVAQCNRKPVVCKKSNSSIVEGAIYYRYRGQTMAIKYPELRNLLDEQRQRDQEMILKHFRKVSEIGIENIGLLNTQNGLVEGPGGSFLIEESLLPKISFLREGNFTETASAPAIKLIGQAKILDSGFIQPVKRVFKTKAIRSQDIVLNFLDAHTVTDPVEYVKQVCFESSAYMPIYYYIAASKLTLSEIVKELDTTITTNPAKERLLKRLSGDHALAIPQPKKGNEATERRALVADQIRKQAYTLPKDSAGIKMFLQALRTMPKAHMDLTFINPILKDIFENNYGKGGSVLADDFRKAICYVDRTYFYPNIKGIN